MVFMLSSPYASAGAFSVTPENFEKALVLHAVKRIPKATWTNDKDAFYTPSSKLPDEFVTDCVIWSAFAGSNNCVSLRNIQYKDKAYQIANQMFPFLLEEVRRWPCGHGDIASQLAAANEDRFLAKWLAARDFSTEARAVLDAARALYREFYANITNTPWMDWKIETWDVGYYQIRNAMKSLGGSRSCATDGAADAQERVPPAEALRAAHDALRAKLLPQIYSLGFLNPDVAYFE